ncbi:MFS transporter [Amycolatopsis sp.]|uniref:MFS transporter n=1 Tax=Amycolatopsis sp. TaxID=37632 RepID=UPI002C533D08|nr:MFS transporter [Amycolatopsis sp.]HVV09970.1 MFS transporter [Amycolatopsis sp.]
MSERTLSAHTPVRGRELRPHRPGIILATLLTCQLMIILDATVMNVALPRIQSDLHFSQTGLSWVLNAYTLVFGGLLLLGGRAGDFFGRRQVFLAGISLFTLASLAGGLADSATWLLVARILQGLGAAAAGPSTLALITTTFTGARERMRALALFSAMSSAGLAVGLILGGLLTEWLSWRSVLFINLPFGLFAVVLGARYLIDPPRRRSQLDLPGAITATGGVAAIVYGFISAASDGWGRTTTLLSLAVGVVLLGAFLFIEIRAEHPLMPLRLFRDRNRATAYTNFFLGPMAGMSMFFFLTQYLQDVRGMTALQTGFAFLPMAVLVFGLSRLIPRLLPRFGPKPTALAGTLSMIAGMLVLTRLSADSGYFPLVFLPMVLMGIGMGLAFAPLNVIIMGSVAPEDAGAAGGVLQTMQQTGATLGLAILVTVFGSASRGATGSPHEVLVTGMTHAFFAAAIIAGVAFLVALTFRRRP